MSTPSVSAVCPGCKETLHIPTSWADKAVKCKKCGSVVRASTPPPPPRANEPAAVVPQPYSPQPLGPDVLSPPQGYPAPPADYAAAPQPYPGTPPGYPYAPPPGYGMPPGYPAVPPGYGPPPGYPAPPPGYGYAPPPGYPYAPPPGYGVPPGYPGAPGYPAPGTGGEPFGGGFRDVPSEDGSRRSRRDGDEDDRPSRKRRYKKASGATKWIVLGVFGALLIGGGTVVALKWDSISASLGMKTQPKEHEKVAPGSPNSPTPGPGTPTPNPGTTPVKPVLTANPTFARRMLVLSSTRYLYCNPLTDGATMTTPTNPKQKAVLQSELSAMARRIASGLKVSADKENNQLYVVTDGGGNLEPSFAARPLLKSIAEKTLTDFCTTCRAQDRAVIYFGGHAFAKAGKAYLVAADGDMQEADGDGLIPLESFWKIVGECPAQQKVVLFDVCRLNEDGDAVRPGSEPMSKELADLLHAPPKGVEVVTACSEGQTAREYRRAPDRLTPPGSVFLHALWDALKLDKTIPAPVNPDDPIPVAEWMAAAQGRLAERYGEKTLTLKHTAGEAAAAVAANPGEKPPERFAYAPMPMGADVTELKAVFEALALAPIKIDEDSREDTGLGDNIADVVFFPAEALADYKTDMTMEEAEKAGDKFPVRAAAAKALKLIRDKWAKDKGSSVQTRFTGEASDAVKKDIRNKQTPLAALDDDLKTLAEEMEAAKKVMDKEESKYWQAMFLYAYAQTKARLAFVNEYNLLLGRYLTETVPEFDKALGLQLVSVEKMSSKADVKEMADAAKKAFTDLIKDHDKTPWAVMAKQYRVVALGLKWQEYKPAAMVDKSKDD